MGSIAFPPACACRSQCLRGERGAGLWYSLQDALNRERLFGGLAAVAWAAARCRRQPVSRGAPRVFGKPISECQAIRHQFAAGGTSLEAARQLDYATFSRWLAGENVTKEICIIKLFSYEASKRAVKRCLQN